jgi:hypothetical protein
MFMETGDLFLVDEEAGFLEGRTNGGRLTYFLCVRIRGHTPGAESPAFVVAKDAKAKALAYLGVKFQ